MLAILGLITAVIGFGVAAKGDSDNGLGPAIIIIGVILLTIGIITGQVPE